MHAESFDELRREIAELRASRERLVLAADAERRGIERELHEGVLQDLVALAVNLQLATQLVDGDPLAARALLDEMRRDVQETLDETTRLAQRVSPRLEPGLAVALRSAFASAGIPVSVDIGANMLYPDTVARTVYLCCVELVDHAEAGARASVTVREETGDVVFEVELNDAGAPSPELDGVRDRVEALGGRLTIATETNGELRVTGSLPVS